MADFKKGLASKKKNLLDLEQYEQKYFSELDTALQQYRHWEGQAQDFDSAELKEEQLALRQEKENAAAQKLQEAYAGQYDPAMMAEAKRGVSRLLGQEVRVQSILETIQKQAEAHRIQRRKAEKEQ